MPRSAPRSKPSLHLQVAREFLAVRQAAKELHQFLAEHRFAEEEIWSCELAFVEACNNAVQHGSAASEKPIAVDVHFSSAELEIRIADEAPFEMPAKAELPPTEAERGRGLYLIQSLMDQVGCERSGADAMNCLVLRKNITGI